MNKPEATEYDPSYAQYISLVTGDAMAMLEAQPEQLRGVVSSLPEDRGTYAYDTGKWTIKELLSHIIDGERHFAYRVLRISRGDETPIEGFEQDGYIENSGANNRTFADLVEEFDLQRRSNMLLFKNIDDTASRRMGTASDKPVSVRALVYCIAGHVEHHLRIINERYLA
jgi:DinB superfamily